METSLGLSRAAPAGADVSALHSRFVQRIRRRYAEDLAALPAGLPDAASITALVQRLQQGGRSLPAALRVARQLCLERLARLDIEQAATLADVTGAMTALAEATLELALAQALADAEARHGVPRDAAGRRIDFWIVGMGKLGARELNVSSDIDLIYVYEDEGETDGIRPSPGRSQEGLTPSGGGAALAAPGGSMTRTSAHEFFSLVAKRLYTLIGETTDDGFVFRVDLALRPNGNSGPAGVQPADAGRVSAGAGPRMGAFRLAEEPRGRAARGSGQRARAGAALAGHALRLPALPRLRRVRGPAPAAPQDPRRGAAPRRRPTRACQRRQAVARRHPRDRVHRAADAGGARRSVPRDPHPLHAEEPAAAGRARADEAGHRAAAGRVLRLPAPRRAPHPVPGRPADAPAAHRRCRPGLDRAQPGPVVQRRCLRAARPPVRGARVRGHRIRRAAARRAGAEHGSRAQRLCRLRCRPAAGGQRAAAGAAARGTGRTRAPLGGAAARGRAARRQQAAPGAAGAARRGLRGRRRLQRGRGAALHRLAGAAAASARATWRCWSSARRCRRGCCACWAWRAGRCST